MTRLILSLMVWLVWSVFGGATALAQGAARPFWTGVDANYFLDLQSKGVRWSVDDRQTEPLDALAGAGANLARIRLWTGDEGVNGLAYATETALRAQRAGLQPLVVIFLSENWADMVKQPVPQVWAALDAPAKHAAVEAYAQRVTRHLIDAGVNVDWVAIGNEIDFGICGVFEEQWPRRVSIEYMRERIWSQMLPIIRAAQSGVRKAKPDARFVLHLAQWNSPEYCAAFFRYMIDGGISVDTAGISYFPTSADKPEDRTLAHFVSRVRQLAGAVGKPILICETAYPAAARFAGQFADWNKPIDGYTLDETGQARWLADLLRISLTEASISGVIYWSPEWCVPGGMWEAFALFDNTGRARPALRSLTVPRDNAASTRP